LGTKFWDRHSGMGSSMGKHQFLEKKV